MKLVALLALFALPTAYAQTVVWSEGSDIRFVTLTDTDTTRIASPQWATSVTHLAGGPILEWAYQQPEPGTDGAASADTVYRFDARAQAARRAYEFSCGGNYGMTSYPYQKGDSSLVLAGCTLTEFTSFFRVAPATGTSTAAGGINALTHSAFDHTSETLCFSYFDNPGKTICDRLGGSDPITINAVGAMDVDAVTQRLALARDGRIDLFDLSTPNAVPVASVTTGETVRQVSLSPSGERVFWTEHDGDRARVQTALFAGGGAQTVVSWRAGLRHVVSLDPASLVVSSTAPTAASQRAVRMSAAPNPTSGVTTLRTVGAVPAGSELVVTDVTGRVHMRVQPRSAVGSSQLTLDLSALPSGMYFALLISSEGQRLASATVVRLNQ